MHVTWTARTALLCTFVLACGESSGGGSGTTGGSTGDATSSSSSLGGSTAAASTGAADSTGPASTSVGPSDSSGGDGTTTTGGDDPIDYAGAMNGYRWELPCEDPSLRDTCGWDPALLDGAIDDPMYTLHREDVITFGGDPSVVYDVQIRIRGLTEPKDFSGGEVQQEYFQIDGTPGTNDYNIYSVSVGDPAHVYTLNRNAMGTGHYTFVVDYTVTIPIRGGTMVTMAMMDPNMQAIANPGGASGSPDPFVVPEIPPFPDPFYGQFLQMDVLAVTPQ